MKLILGLTVAEGRRVGEAYPMATQSPYCHERAADDDRSTYTCTRNAGHEGPHVAHVPDGTAVVLWPAVMADRTLLAGRNHS